MYDLSAEIRKMIGEIYDGGSWEQVSDLYNRDGEAWQLWKFEQAVEFEGKNYWAVIIEKHNLDPDDVECVEDVETVFEKYIKL